jgi:hypothetical protein
VDRIVGDRRDSPLRREDDVDQKVAVGGTHVRFWHPSGVLGCRAPFRGSSTPG